jgi:hypothetical protein
MKDGNKAFIGQIFESYLWHAPRDHLRTPQRSIGLEIYRQNSAITKSYLLSDRSIGSTPAEYVSSR